MNATELAAALDTVEQDHRLVLEKMQMLKDIVHHLFDIEGLDARPVVGRLGDLNKYFATEFEAHLEEEEVTLFPLLERHQPGGRDLVSRLRQEHGELRRKRADFEKCLDVAGELMDPLPRAVLRDLLTYGWELWDLLDNHALTETRAVQQCIADSLAAESAKSSDAASVRIAPAN
jgi:hypothetical protein